MKKYSHWHEALTPEERAKALEYEAAVAILRNRAIQRQRALRRVKEQGKVRRKYGNLPRADA